MVKESGFYVDLTKVLKLLIYNKIIYYICKLSIRTLENPMSLTDVAAKYNIVSLKCAAMIVLSLVTEPAYTQNPDAAKRATSIELLPLPGMEALPVHKAQRPDTINFKPHNFRFPDIDRQTLSERLAMGVFLPIDKCSPAWGLFAFRVNAAGKVDSTWYRGSLTTITSDQILANIRGTDGLWIIKPDTRPTHKAWFVYPFFDTRGRYESDSKCTEAEKVLLRAVSSLSNLVINLFYQVDHDHNRATMIMPTERDEVPKL